MIMIIIESMRYLNMKCNINNVFLVLSHLYVTSIDARVDKMRIVLIAFIVCSILNIVSTNNKPVSKCFDSLCPDVNFLLESPVSGHDNFLYEQKHKWPANRGAFLSRRVI